MRIATFQTGTATSVGFIIGARVVDLAPLARRRRIRPPQDMLALIETIPVRGLRQLHDDAREWIDAGRPSLPVGRVKLRAPIPRPRKNIFCMGRNYVEHAREGGVAPPEVPVFFTKPPTAVVGPGAPVTYHRATQSLDYEVELVAVIGRRGKNIPEPRALDYVFGYTIMNDITARDLQRRHQQWFKGKSLDTSAPMGPWIVHRSAIPDPQALHLSMRVNGDTRQDSSTANMLFSVAKLIEALSTGLTLEPGDLLATGTPEGVGMGFSPPKWLQVGDVVEAEVEHIGILKNRIVAER